MTYLFHANSTKQLQKKFIKRLLKMNKKSNESVKTFTTGALY